MNEEKIFPKKMLYGIFALTAAGLLFSGYLSAIKLFTGTCAFSESCPYFLGYPACWYGFVMYLSMFMTTASALCKKISAISALKTDISVAGLGVIFAGNFAIEELLSSRLTGDLGLSTCVYGLIFYIAILTTSIIALKKIRAAEAASDWNAI